MATRKTTAVKKETPDEAAPAAKAAPRRRTTKVAEAPVIDIRLTPEEAEGKLRDEIARHAYLLWESGVPGDQHSHWLAAEQAVRSA